MGAPAATKSASSTAQKGKDGLPSPKRGQPAAFPSTNTISVSGKQRLGMAKHLAPGSTWHRTLQPSPSLRLPSSQPSPSAALTTPSPHGPNPASTPASAGASA